MAGFGKFVQTALKTSFAPPNTGFGVAGALFAGQLAAPAIEAAVEGGGLGRVIEQEGQAYKNLLLKRMRQERIQRQVREASARLAAADPHLYSEIMAGERLVPGEMVIGGQPRTDLLGMIASRMAMGAYAQKPPVQDDVMAFLQQR